jgi:hypothetical protein
MYLLLRGGGVGEGGGLKMADNLLVSKGGGGGGRARRGEQGTQLIVWKGQTQVEAQVEVHIQYST